MSANDGHAPIPNWNPEVKFMDVTLAETMHLRDLAKKDFTLRKFLARLESSIDLEVVPGFNMLKDDD